MPYPSVSDFRRLLTTQPLEEIVEQHVFSGVPYVFRNNPRLEAVLSQHLCQWLPLQPQDIAIIGSAKIGFSLSPDNFPRRFSDASDIDVLIVNDKLFDDVWLTLLKWNYPRRFALPHEDWNWMRRRREELFWGWFTPDRIRYDGLSFPDIMKPLRDLSTAWFDAFRSLSRYPAFSRREVSGRLYRSRAHALQYHVEGLRQIRELLAGDQEGV